MPGKAGQRGRNSVTQIYYDPVGHWVVVIVAFFVGSMGSRTISRRVAGLQPGRPYYWKVVAEDGKGGTVHSETRRFEIR